MDLYPEFSPILFHLSLVAFSLFSEYISLKPFPVYSPSLCDSFLPTHVTILKLSFFYLELQKDLINPALKKNLKQFSLAN